MAWTLDDSIQRRAFNQNKHFDVEAASMSKYHQWKRKINDLGMYPKVAAEAVGDMHYEQLSGKNKGEYTVRLSQQHRVAFTRNDRTKVVTVFQIGGHYPNETN